MRYELKLMRRAAKIAGNTKCWIGIGCVIAKGGKILIESWNETLGGEEYCREFRRTKADLPASRLTAPAGWQAGGRRPKDGNVGCLRHELGLKQGESPEKVCSVHAESNAIAKAARQGIKIDGAVMFVTSFPCLICMRAIVASGISKIFYMNDFYKPHHEEMFKKNNVKIEQIAEDKVWRGK